MLNLTEDNLEKIIAESNKPVFVDMYADWCGPCKMIAPLVEELSKEYGDKVEFISVDVDANAVSTATYGVRSIPTLLVFNRGELMKRHSGAIPKNKIVELFQNYIV